MPEPATIALFGTGCVAMVLRYIKVQYLRAKPIFDKVVAAALLVIFAPVIGFCALLVRLTSKGPAFYNQERVGENGVIFKMFKLRTMRADAEAITGPVWTPDDHSELVTPVGWILRRTHIDELPQLINVLRGEMSIVGPRPLAQDEVDKFKVWQRRRLSMKPGITGLWQLNGNWAVNDFEDIVRLDCEYIDKWSLWLDCKILSKTVAKVLRGSGW